MIALLSGQNQRWLALLQTEVLRLAVKNRTVVFHRYLASL
jgi:hypothetical protein